MHADRGDFALADQVFVITRGILDPTTGSSSLVYGNTPFAPSGGFYYAKLVYVGQTHLGEINADRLAKLQDFYLAKGIIQKKTPVDELYSNAFIK